ncbi:MULTISPECIES: DNA polymerase I [unclassified Chelatococcus]|uniref:DNA polymerase I n=1 Tax=unclassified Chelatococcus TaxID=2638111 RepID=UPI001BD1A929|nr:MULTISPECIES: DNA polymerase I [unclassified Chelatococcus]MBS7697385.1 DNA polymerase I [Chelatococcus sp. YT9]MBX3560015.1 DNA polymerase I [Chelatococcus sp.]
MSDAAPLKPGDHVFLVDGSSFVFRAYFQSMNQDRKYNYRSDGLPTGAVRLFCTKLFQFVREGAVGTKPTHLAIIFDKSEQSFRKELYPLYKANRSEPPEDLVPQFPLMREAVRAFGLKPVEQDRYEADDLIATYAKQATAAGADVLIISADKDLMQLIGPRVAMYDPASGTQSKGSFRPERRIGLDEVVDYFGVTPDKVVDVQSLAGDSTDNVPGAPGIGIKTAAQLIAEYGGLDELLARAGEIKQPKRRETLTNPEIVEKILISRQLVSLVDDVAVETPLADLSLVEPDAAPLVSFLKALEFTTITKRVSELYGVDAAEIEPDPRLAVGTGSIWSGPSTGVATGETGAEAAPSGNGSQAAAVPAPAGAAPASGQGNGGLGTPAELAAKRAGEALATPVNRDAYETVMTLERLDQWIAMAREAGRVAIDTETTSLDVMQADLVGISLAVAPGQACYIPLQHKAEGGDGLFGGGPLPGQIAVAEAIARLKPLLESRDVLKIGQNLKYDWLIFSRHGIDISAYDDTMLMSYALDAGRSGIAGHGLDALSEKFIGHTPLAFGDVAGKGRNAVTFDRVAVDKATAYAAEDADVALRLWQVFKARLVAEGKTTVYETLERPLLAVLARMEGRGIAIDRQILSRLSGSFAQTLARLEEEIYELAGERFTIGSPKQLGDILFGKMGLPGAKKTATGQWSTGASVLEDLAAEGHALPVKILEWRQLAKLKSTYTDALPGYVNPQTQRVHTSYSLAATTTGRLSSSEPNLQNIPVRTEEGRKIRTAFVATRGMKLISADYSQIELRLLAHIADIPQLRKAFSDGIDIHAMTASEMFGVPVKGMDPMIRRRAKAINFGIIYGISAFGLANQLSIPREEAGAYIRKYFERFPGIRDYMDKTKAFCRENGYVTTIFGRVCHYPDIKSSNPSQRAFVERQAINAPLQGSASDIIRRAMARMEKALSDAGLSARMLLQVHDELVFEVPDGEVDATLPLIQSVMEQAPLPAVALKVPLHVDARAAANWEEAH